MSFSYAYHSDTGTTRSVNQDSLVIKTARENGSVILMAAVCDGLGGLERGEAASRRAVTMLSDWFDQEFRKIAQNRIDRDILERRLKELVRNINTDIYAENLSLDSSSGTTLSMLLLTGSEKILIHVGDSRIYEISDGCMHQLTKDHSWVAMQVEQNRMTPEEAEKSPRQNILLQCVGSKPELDAPQINISGAVPNASYLICSDGFWHHMNQEALLRLLRNGNSDTFRMDAELGRLSEEVKLAGETDNITAILITESANGKEGKK